MSKITPLSRTFQILNIILSILAVAFSVAAILFFLAVQNLTSVRNPDRYLIDETIHIPQVIPWIIVAAAVFVILVALCGCISAAKSCRNLLTVYIVCITMGVLAFIAVAVVAYLNAKSEATENFVKNTILDVFQEMNTREDAASVFHRMEKALRCCGAYNSRSYTGDQFPASCCGLPLDSGTGCPKTDLSANARNGCIVVVTNKVGWIMKGLSAGAIVLSFVGVLCIYLGLHLCIVLRSRTKSRASLVKKFKHIETSFN